MRNEGWTFNFTDNVIFSANVKADGIVHGDYFDVNGIKHIKLVDIDVKIKVGKGQIQLNNLFEKSEELNANTNKVINDNADAITEEFIPVIQEFIKQFSTHILQQIFKKYSFDTLFPV